MTWGKGTKNDRKTGRQTTKRLSNIENKLRGAGGEVVGGWVKWVMDTGEGTFGDEHWVPYVRDAPLGSVSEAKTTLHVN